MFLKNEYNYDAALVIHVYQLVLVCLNLLIVVCFHLVIYHAMAKMNKFSANFLFHAFISNIEYGKHEHKCLKLQDN